VRHLYKLHTHIYSDLDSFDFAMWHLHARVPLVALALTVLSFAHTFHVSSGKVEENHCRIRATEGEVYLRSGRKELGLEGASRCYIWDGDWVITHVPRDKPYGRHHGRRDVSIFNIFSRDAFFVSKYASIGDSYVTGECTSGRSSVALKYDA
jgi:hypothetical protein